MNTFDAIKQRRTTRKFKQTPIASQDVCDIIECARLAPTGANLQSLKYMIVSEKNVREKMFPHIKYAGYLPEWNPAFDECPPVFVVVLNDTSIKPTDKCEVDCGSAIMSMCLAATEKGIGSCWLGAISRPDLKEILGVEDKFDITYLLGLGYPDQDAKAVDVTDGIKYYFDENGMVCVPKRSMEEILISDFK